MNDFDEVMRPITIKATTINENIEALQLEDLFKIFYYSNKLGINLLKDKLTRFDILEKELFENTIERFNKIEEVILKFPINENNKKNLLKKFNKERAIIKELRTIYGEFVFNTRAILNLIEQNLNNLNVDIQNNTIEFAIEENNRIYEEITLKIEKNLEDIVRVEEQIQQITIEAEKFLNKY